MVKVTSWRTLMRTLPFLRVAILLAVLFLLVGGCNSSTPQEARASEPQPTSSFADGEATAIVQTWLGQRTYSLPSCTRPFTPVYSCPDDAKKLTVGNCLSYLTRTSFHWSETFQSALVSRVTLQRGGAPYLWDVYRPSDTVRTVRAPAGPCR